MRDQNPARALSKIGLDKDIAAAVLADLRGEKNKNGQGERGGWAFEGSRKAHRPVVVKLQAPGGSLIQGFRSGAEGGRLPRRRGAQANTRTIWRDAVPNHRVDPHAIDAFSSQLISHAGPRGGRHRAR